MKSKTSKQLLGSVISLMLCCTMLIGTTFAWFTDTATTAVNSIQSGTLDVDLVDGAGNTLVGDTLNFLSNGAEKTDILWEPGCTYELEDVYIKNNGNLALKYKLEIAGIEGDAKLLESIDWTVDLGTDEDIDLETFEGYLAANTQTGVLKLTGHMDENAGNEYQNLNITGIAITVFATQDTVEFDSVDNLYDENAKYDIPEKTVTVADAAELTEALANITEPTVIDATGVTLDIPDQKFNIVGGVTLKNATINTSSRAGTYLIAEAGVGEEIVYDNCTFTRYDTGANIVASDANGPDLTFNNCTFEGPIMPNCVDNPDGNIQFNNCTFEITDNAMIKSGYVNCMGGTHTFTNCTFDYTGGSTMGSNQYVRWNAVNSYSESGYTTTVNLVGCTLINCGTQRYGSNSTLNIQ